MLQQPHVKVSALELAEGIRRQRFAGTQHMVVWPRASKSLSLLVR